MGIMQYIFIAVLIEAVVETLKMTWDKDKLNKSRIVALLVSFICCLSFRIDLFNYVGFETAIPIIPYFLTGIIVSRGSNFISDLLQKLNGKGE